MHQSCITDAMLGRSEPAFIDVLSRSHVSSMTGGVDVLVRYTTRELLVWKREG